MISEIFKESFAFVLSQLGLAWWLEIVTEQPRCVYYFGPFVTLTEAEFFQPGYIEDLEQEAAQGISVTSKRCQQPKELTVFEDEFIS